MSFERQFLAFIRAYYRTRGMSVGQLGRTIGRSRRQTYRIVNAERQITIKEMEQILASVGYRLEFTAVPIDEEGEGER